MLPVRLKTSRRLLVSLILFFTRREWTAAAFQKPTTTNFCSIRRMSMLRLVEDDYGVYQDGRLEISRKPSSIFQLYYRIYHPMGTRTPLVIVHGGPSLPSQYLYPLVNMISIDRPVIFYDQLGCGGSDEPKDLSCYSIPLSVLDMNVVIEHTLRKISLSRASEGNASVIPHACDQLHLFGHSYGGSLAYEYVRYQLSQAKDDATSSRQSQSAMHPSSSRADCRSLILCNGIQNMQRSNDDYDQLYTINPKGFWGQHACREGIPPPLQDSLDHLGTTWGGMESVLDYVAMPLPKLSSPKPATLIIVGGRDFGYRASNEEVWNLLLGDAEVEVVKFNDCAHYPFYEEKEKFGRLLEGFLERIDCKWKYPSSTMPGGQKFS